MPKLFNSDLHPPSEVDESSIGWVLWPSRGQRLEGRTYRAFQPVCGRADKVGTRWERCAWKCACAPVRPFLCSLLLESGGYAKGGVLSRIGIINSNAYEPPHDRSKSP
jgi:hypothetical protein